MVFGKTRKHNPENVRHFRFNLFSVLGNLKVALAEKVKVNCYFYVFVQLNIIKI